MSKGLSTFGGNTDRGKSFFVLDANGNHWRISPDDLSNPQELNADIAAQTAINQGAWGRDCGVFLGYTASPYVRQFRDPQESFSTWKRFAYIDSDANPLSADYPFSISYVNGQFVSVCTVTSGTPIVIYTSENGTNWTKITTGPTAQGTGAPNKMEYNPDDGRYAFADRSSNHIYYSDDNMATWSTTTPGTGTAFDIAYGNGIWMVSYLSNGMYYSDDNMSSWTSTSAPFNCYNVSFNEYNNYFWIGGGPRQGNNNYDARIARTNDGSTWSTVYSGTANIYVNSIQGDDQGNMLATGFTDDGIDFTGTTAYLYSTDDGDNWTEGAFSTTVETGYSNSIFFADGARNYPTPTIYGPYPEGAFDLEGIDQDTYTDYPVPTHSSDPSYVNSVYFSPDGSKMYISGGPGGSPAKALYYYTLSMPFDPSTYTYIKQDSITSGYLGQVAWNDTGSNLYYGVRYTSSSAHYQRYTDPFDTSSTQTLNANDSGATDGRWPHPDLTYLWIGDSDTVVRRLVLDANGEPVSGLNVGTTYTFDENVGFFQWANNGTYFFAHGYDNGGIIKRFTCSTPYDLSTRTEDQAVDFTNRIFISHNGQYLFEPKSTSGLRRYRFF